MSSRATPKQKAKRFDCLAFKDEMQRLSRERLEGIPDEELPRRLAEFAARGPFAKWRKRLSASPFPFRLNAKS